MGGIFGKNKRLCVLPDRVTFSKRKGRKTSGTPPVFCDASTWTGENHFQSARIGRTPKGAELSAVKLVLVTPESEAAAQAEWEAGEQAASRRAQRTETVLLETAGDTGGVEVPQDPEAQPRAEVMQHQELNEQPKQEAESDWRSQESSKTEAVLTPTGSCIPKEQLSCGDHQLMPLTWTVVKAEVHVSADLQGGSGKVQSALLESELPTGEEQEAGVVCGSEETCAGKTDQEVPVQKAADPPAALCTTEGAEPPLETTETPEGNTNVQRPVEEPACCAAQAPPGLQLEQGTEVSIAENMEENPLEAEEGEERAEVSDDGKASEEIPHSLVEAQAALQEEKMKATKGGKPEEHLKEHMKSGAATTEQTGFAAK